MEEKEKELKSLNAAILEGKVRPEDVKSKIEGINKEIAKLKDEINKETIKVHSILKSLGDLKAKTEQILPISEIREALANARKALGKKDLVTAKKYLKKARDLASKKKSKEAKALLKEIQALDERIKRLGEIKEKKLEELKKPEHRGLFSALFESLAGLIHAHKREIQKEEITGREKIAETKRKIKELREKIEELKKEKANPKELAKARAQLEELEKELIHLKAKPALPAKEIEKTLEKAEKTLAETRKTLDRLKAVAEEQKSKRLAKSLEGTWVKTLIAQKHVEMTKDELKKMAEALKESERRYAQRMKKLEKVKKQVEKATLPLEYLLIEYIEHMKPGQIAKVKDIAKALRVSEREALEKLKGIEGSFKLENTGLLARLLGKEPQVIRL